MPKPLQSLLDEADSIIKGKLDLGVKTASDDVTKLADELICSSPVTEYTSIEKLAYARAMIDTVLNMDYLKKVAELEDRASKAGIPGEKIAEFFEKKAAQNFKSVLDLF